MTVKTADIMPHRLGPMRTGILVAVLFAAGIIIYSNTFHAAMVLDDNSFIINDPSVHMTQLSWGGIKTAALDGKPRHRYLPNISFAVNYYFGRLNPFGYHLVNLVIHLLTGIFLFFFIKNTLRASILDHCRGGGYPRPKREGIKPPPTMDATITEAFDYKIHPDIIAFFAALLWVVQPVGTGAVTYICQRMASMVALFYILSLLLYARGRIAMRQTPSDWRKPCLYFSGCLISFICAMATKENAGTLPLVILIYEWFFFQNLSINGSRRQILWIVFFVFVFACGVFWFMGENPIIRIINSYTQRDFSLPERVMTEWRIMIYYISLFFWAPPGRLNLDHDYPLSLSPGNPATTIIALAAIVSLLALAAYAAKKDRLIAFCILWFFITQATESTVIGIELIFEHRTYIPFMMTSLFFVLVIFRVIQNRPMTCTLLIATALIFSAWTYQRNQTWRNPVQFWTDCVTKSPNKPRPKDNLGLALYDTGDISGAITQYKKSISIDPNMPYAHNNLGNALLKQGKINEAIQCFYHALAINPNLADAYNNLGNAFFKQGKMDEAIQCFRRALSLNPSFTEAYSNLGNVFFNQGRLNKAIPLFQRALALEPDFAGAHNNLGNAFSRQGKTDEAIRCFRQALALDPDHIEAQNNLANALMKKGHIQSAIQYFQAILKKQPDHVEANINLGAALARQGQINKAITHYRAALKSDPNNPEAHNNLGVLFVQKRMFAEAMAQFKRAVALRPGYASAINNLRRLKALTAP